ncbi:MAG: DUF3179 domain-containing protein [Candidatus Rokubacteria bacterium]|nr:DUF3179 domain-containing protein [Candidatus Rokubacteria bacterium]
MSNGMERDEVRRSGVRLSRRGFLGSLGTLVVAGSSGWVGFSALAAAPKAWSPEDFVKNVQHGGPPKDGIPPIDRPKYVSASGAEKFLRAGDIVFGLEYRGVVKAYPQKILVWHEIVNEEIGGEKLSITYCPLTGSAVGFKGSSRGDRAALTFGTTGKLVNSNLLMYDRQTDSQWPQILGVAIAGPNKGTVLEEIPLAWTTWGPWRAKHPESLVLSTDTGFFRAYGSDPYGSYERRGTYYDSGGSFFPVMTADPRFPDKHVVIGIKANGARLAIPKAAVAWHKVINASLAGVPLVALYDQELAAVRVFARRAGTTVLTFRREGNTFVDEQTRAPWTATGRCQGGRLSGTQLPVLAAYDVMWFAWYAFFPRTEVREATTS